MLLCFRVATDERLAVLSVLPCGVTIFDVMIYMNGCVCVAGERGREDGSDPGRATADGPREAPPHLGRPTEGGGRDVAHSLLFI